MHDWPAAHSMDTTWFAVDRNGLVASFWSGEAGAVPTAFRELGQVPATADVGEGVYEYEHANRFEYRYQLPEGVLWDDLRGARVSGPYMRQSVPVVPIHIDQLPPEVRSFLLTVQFPSVSFADDQAIQPAELAPCDSEQSEYLTLAGERHEFLPAATKEE